MGGSTPGLSPFLRGLHGQRLASLTRIKAGRVGARSRAVLRRKGPAEHGGRWVLGPLWDKLALVEMMISLDMNWDELAMLCVGFVWGRALSRGGITRYLPRWASGGSSCVKQRHTWVVRSQKSDLFGVKQETESVTQGMEAQTNQI